jgi:hypothetical protein
MPDLATPSGILWFLLTCVVALLMFAARTTPGQVKSNLSAWAESCGIRHVPAWLRSRSADRTALRAGRSAAQHCLFEIFPPPSREVVRDPEARYFGSRVEERSLVPLGEARLGRIGFGCSRLRTRCKTLYLLGLRTSG